MASKFRQEMPPAGGYGNIQWARKFGRPNWSGYTKFGVFVAATTVGFALFYWERQIDKRHNLEMNDARIALEPLMLAERNRMFLKRLHQNREEEKELMKNVPGWEVGTLYGKPVFNNKDRFPMIHPEEYFAHNTQADMFDRLLERRYH